MSFPSIYPLDRRREATRPRAKIIRHFSHLRTFCIFTLNNLAVTDYRFSPFFPPVLCPEEKF